MWCKGCTPTSVGGKSSILFMGSNYDTSCHCSWYHRLSAYGSILPLPRRGGQFHRQEPHADRRNHVPTCTCHNPRIVAWRRSMIPTPHCQKVGRQGSCIPASDKADDSRQSLACRSSHDLSKYRLSASSQSIYSGSVSLNIYKQSNL